MATILLGDSRAYPSWAMRLSHYPVHEHEDVYSTQIEEIVLCLVDLNITKHSLIIQASVL